VLVVNENGGKVIRVMRAVEGREGNGVNDRREEGGKKVSL
jgi:hypothetical protein